MDVCSNYLMKNIRRYKWKAEFIIEIKQKINEKKMNIWYGHKMLKVNVGRLIIMVWVT